VRQHQILEGIRWIPSDTSGGVLGRGLTQVISVIDLTQGQAKLKCSPAAGSGNRMPQRDAAAVPLGEIPTKPTLTRTLTCHR